MSVTIAVEPVRHRAVADVHILARLVARWDR
jgi:hypothetical protein